MLKNTLKDVYAVRREDVSFDMSIVKSPTKRGKIVKRIQTRLTHRPTGIKVSAEYSKHSVEIEERLLGRLDMLVFQYYDKITETPGKGIFE